MSRRNGTGSTTITRAPMPIAAAAETRPMVPPPEITTVSRGIDAAMAQHGVIAAGERLDQGAFRVVHGVGQLVQPLGTRRKELAIGAIHRKPEMVDALGRIDDAFADHPVAAFETRHVLADLDHFAHPFVARVSRGRRSG